MMRWQHASGVSAISGQRHDWADGDPSFVGPEWTWMNDNCFSIDWRAHYVMPEDSCYGSSLNIGPPGVTRGWPTDKATSEDISWQGLHKCGQLRAQHPGATAAVTDTNPQHVAIFHDYFMSILPPFRSSLSPPPPHTDAVAHLLSN